MEKICHSYKLNNSIIGEKIKVIVSNEYNLLDKEILRNCFEKLNFRNILIEEENKYYKLDLNKAYLNILKDYMSLTYINDYQKKEIYLIPLNFFLFNDLDNIDFLLEFIKKKIDKRELYLLGYGKYLEDIYTNFEKKYHNPTYLFAHHETYIIDTVINL